MMREKRVDHEHLFDVVSLGLALRDSKTVDNDRRPERIEQLRHTFEVRCLEFLNDPFVKDLIEGAAMTMNCPKDFVIRVRQLPPHLMADHAGCPKDENAHR